MHRHRLLLLATLLPLGCSKAAPSEPFPIGHLAVTSGPDIVAGTQAEQGIRLAVEETNADPARHIAGRRVVVLHADTQGQLDNFTTQTTRLAKVNKVVALLGGTTPEQSDTIAPLAQSYELIVIGMSGHTGAPPAAAAFALGLSPAARAAALARFAAETLKVPRIAVVADRRGSAAVAFVRAASRHPLAAEEWPWRKPEDRADLAKRLAAAAPPAVLLVGAVEEVLPLRAELAKAGLPAAVPVLFGGGEEALPALRADRAAEGLYLAVAYPEEPDDALPKLKAFGERYQQRFGQSAEPAAALAYDSARVLFEGTRQAGTFQAAKLRAALAALKDFPALTGPLSFAPDQTARCPAFLVQMRAGKGRAVGRVDAEKE